MKVRLIEIHNNTSGWFEFHLGNTNDAIPTGCSLSSGQKWKLSLDERQYKNYLEVLQSHKIPAGIAIFTL